jgi:uncharacterized protein (TIGR00725 family)
MSRKIIVGVVGPGERASQTDKSMAYELGQMIAKEGWVTLSGGRNSGVMDAVSRGAQDAGGLTVGILPTSGAERISSAIDIPIITDMGSARNNINVLSSNVVIACGMGKGTASEVALALKANVPVILLNTNSIANQFFTDLDKSKVSVMGSAQEAIGLCRKLVN